MSLLLCLPTCLRLAAVPRTAGLERDKGRLASQEQGREGLNGVPQRATVPRIPSLLLSSGLCQPQPAQAHSNRLHHTSSFFSPSVPLAGSPFLSLTGSPFLPPLPPRNSHAPPPPCAECRQTENKSQPVLTLPVQPEGNHFLVTVANNRTEGSMSKTRVQLVFEII